MFSLASTGIAGIFESITAVATGFTSMATTLFAWAISEPLILLGFGFTVVFAIIGMARRFMKTN